MGKSLFLSCYQRFGRVGPPNPSSVILVVLLSYSLLLHQSVLFSSYYYLYSYFVFFHFFVLFILCFFIFFFLSSSLSLLLLSLQHILSISVLSNPCWAHTSQWRSSSALSYSGAAPLSGTQPALSCPCCSQWPASPQAREEWSLESCMRWAWGMGGHTRNKKQTNWANLISKINCCVLQPDGCLKEWANAASCPHLSNAHLLSSLETTRVAALMQYEKPETFDTWVSGECAGAQPLAGQQMSIWKKMAKSPHCPTGGKPMTDPKRSLQWLEGSGSCACHSRWSHCFSQDWLTVTHSTCGEEMALWGPMHLKETSHGLWAWDWLR